jgi:ribosomal protein S19E (S16A)
MTDVGALINRIDQELAAEVKSEKAAWAERVQTTRDREQRLQRYEPVAKRLIDLL